MTSMTIGGPTFFVQAPNSDVWGEFELPEGKSIERGDKLNIFECRFLGVLYQELSCPKSDDDIWSEETIAASKAWREAIKQEGVRVTYVADRMMFVTLAPMEG